MLPVFNFHKKSHLFGKTSLFLSCLCRYAAVYLAAGMENLLEEVILQCLPDDNSLLTAPIFEHAIATNGDLWGLLQPYAHLNAGRTATG
jgi:ankyrin repeat and BTB/POZ domain-containing protein 2